MRRKCLTWLVVVLLSGSTRVVAQSLWDPTASDFNPQHAYARGLLSWFVVLPPLIGGPTWFATVGGYHATLVNMTTAGSGWAPSPWPWYGAIKLDAVDDYLTLGTNTLFDFVNITFTVSVALESITDTLSSTYVLDRRGGGGGGYFLRVETASPGPSEATFRMLDSGGSPALERKTVGMLPYDGRPHVLTVVVTTVTATGAGNDIQFYIDGVFNAGTTSIANTGTGYGACGSCSLLVGVRNDLAAGLFANMKLRDLRFYTRGLSATEIADLPKQVPPTFGGLLQEQEWFVEQFVPAGPTIRRRSRMQ